MLTCEGALLSLRTVLFSLAMDVDTALASGSVDVHASFSLLLPLLLLLLCWEVEGRQE